VLSPAEVAAESPAEYKACLQQTCADAEDALDQCHLTQGIGLLPCTWLSQVLSV